MTIPVTLFGAESASGIGALGIDGKVLLVQLITFILAFFVLRRCAFGPILKVLDQRRETIESGVSLGEEMKRERAKLDTQVEQELQQARQQADGIIAGAEDTAKQTVRASEDQARDKAAGILADAQDRAETETNQARQKLQKELAGLVADATEAIIGEKVDAKKDASLIDKALKGRANV